ncbi:P-loop containing nucleoside triphosphate hydrolase protein [Xylariaceae sp. FL1651]|nr:P-loop containing nucleoside triphosphate hydrolase protein [Xylariaceae sp. FL1651]
MSLQDEVPSGPLELSFETLDEPFELRKFSIADTTSTSSMYDRDSTDTSSSDPTLCERPDSSFKASSDFMLAIVVDAFNLWNVAPNLQASGTALAACGNVFNTIERRSPLGPTASVAEDGGELDHVDSALRLDNIKYIYLPHPCVAVLDDIKLDIPSGKPTALAGSFGFGKSIIVGFLFESTVVAAAGLPHEPRTGSLDTTIYNNILYGLPNFNGDDSDDLREGVIRAAKKANVHEFISLLPEGYEANIVERRFLLLGGQKQRIAIARPIISDPKRTRTNQAPAVSILLLDEATSTLDTKLEEVVQAALKAASGGRTTITIAHHLSTIKNADNIAVISKGSIVEQGTHSELLIKRGAYNFLTRETLLAASPLSEWCNSGVISTALQRISQISTLSRIEGGFTYEDFDPHFAYSEVCNNRRSQVRASSVYSQYSTVGDLVKRNSSTKRYRLYPYSQYSRVEGERQQPLQIEEWKEEEKFVASFNKQEWKLMIWGLFWAIICGGGNPFHAFLFAKQVLTLGVPITSDNRHEIKKSW